MPPSTSPLPRLIGVVHLAPLPGSPRFSGDLGNLVGSAARDAHLLVDAGFEGVLIENFGDAPFYPGRVEAVTVAAMTACALAVRAAASNAVLGVNVLRNDADAALAVAVATGADLIRVNVHTGARVTDQGVVQGLAHETLRKRRELGAQRVRLLCDVDVKHSAPLAPRSLVDEAHDLAERGLADALLVTGAGTGLPTSTSDVDTVANAVSVPVFVASGVTESSLDKLGKAYGVIVGSALRASGRAGDPVDHDRAKRFADAFLARRGSA